MPTDRRLTTIVAADVAGCSRLVSHDEEGTLARFRDLRSRLIDPEIASAGGRLVKTMGDGLLIEFGSPVAALRAVLACSAPCSPKKPPPPKIAARPESLAPPGGICISRAVHDQVQSKVAAPLVAMGPQQVKNIPHPVDTWQVQLTDAPPRNPPDPPSPRA